MQRGNQAQLFAVLVAVLIPCHNEAMSIAKVIGDFRAALPRARILVYDNNSADETVECDVHTRAFETRLRELGKPVEARYYTGHCTGQKAFSVLKEVMDDTLQLFPTGACVEV